jgi:antitoxin (DNA-binding transcriptional repressor) of toxin-antitoxin stability system
MKRRLGTTINAKQLCAWLPRLVARVRKGARYTVLYRSRPAFQIVPIDDPEAAAGPLDDDSVYGSGPVGRSRDGRGAADHDPDLSGE